MYETFLTGRSYEDIKNSLAVMDSSENKRKKIAIIGGGLVRIYLAIFYYLIIILKGHY